jgi:hypothetical protein
VTFGLQIALDSMADAIGPIIMGIAFVIFNEMFLVSSVAYMIGFNSRGAASLGASLLGRGGDSILFASIGGSLTNPDGTKMLDKADQLYPFSGGLSLVTNFMVPLAIRKSVPFAVGLGNILPKSVIFSGAAIGKAMRPAIIHRREPGEPRQTVLTILPMVLVVAALFSIYGAMFSVSELTLAGATVSMIALVAMYFPLKRMMARTLKGADFSSAGFKVKRIGAIASYAPVATIVLLTIPTVVTMVWFIEWWLAPLAALGVVMIVLVMGAGAHHRSVDREGHHHAKKHINRHLKEQKSKMRERYRKK